MRRLLTAVVGSGLVLALATGCSGDGGGREITVYSGRAADLVEPILNEFAEESGISVNFLPGDSADLAITIDEEGEDTRADVFLSQSPGAMSRVEAGGRLLPLPEPLFATLIDRSLASENRTWISVSGRQRVLVYNTGTVASADLPTSVLDLPDSDLRLGVAPTNASFQDFVTALRLEVGDSGTREWLAGLAESGARVYPNNTAIVEAVARGEIDAGLVNHYYALRKLDEEPDSPVANHVFAATDPGSLLLVSSIAVIDHGDAERSAAATELVEFLIGETAQRYFADKTFEYPVTSGVAPATGVPSLDAVRADRVDVNALEGGLEGTLELIRAAGLAS
jgi:iron(III) transport system substrate-binding protein